MTPIDLHRSKTILRGNSRITIRSSLLLTLIMLHLFSMDTLHAQSLERQLIASASIIKKTGDVRSEGSLGQLAGSALYSENLVVTQGFHQGEITDDPTALGTGSELSGQVKAWPNPLTNLLNIEWSADQAVEKIRVFDLVGREQPVNIQRSDAGFSPLPTYRYQLDLERVGAGNYLILLETAGKTLAKVRVTKLN